MLRPGRQLLAFAVLLLGLAAPPARGLTPLAPDEARGKQIYSRGTSASGAEITAALGEDRSGSGTEVSAAALPCGGCHGADGHGGKEGGVRPSDITHEALGRAAAAGSEGGGRRRPAYDDHKLIRAITLGLDSGGNRLHVAMPRYRLTRQDAADLLAYLKRLGHEEEPGLAAGAIHLGVLLPGAEGPGTPGEALRSALTARGAEVNRQGGIYGRRLDLRFVPLPAGGTERGTALAAALAADPPFALLAVSLAGDEAGIAAAAATAGVPLITALTPRPREDFPLNRQVFYLTPGLAEQVAALVAAAARELPPGERSLAVVPAAAPELAALAGTAAAAARERGFSVATVAPAGAAEDAELNADMNAAALLLLDGGAGARELLRRAAARGRHPLVLLPAALVGDDFLAALPAAWRERLIVALPMPPPSALAAAGVPSHHAALQKAAVAALAVLIEGMERTGRELTREKLIASLETLYRFDAGLGAPVTFGPNRRIGARGAFLMNGTTTGALGGPVAWFDLGP
jgi:ABC-type branched-subunit amino acid transport system substrate-binding protein